MVRRRPRQRRPRLRPPLGGGAAGRGGARLAERGRAARGAQLGGGVAGGDAARGGARRARRRAGRPRRDLHADVPRRRGRVARMRARRRGAGADLLRLRGARDRVAARGLRREGRPLRGLVAAARQAHRDAADAGRCRPVRGRARRRVEPGERRVARARDAAARNAASARGRLRGAVSARLHLRHDREAEGSAARAGRLPRLDRAGGRVPERRQGRRPHPFRHRHGLDHGTVDARRRRRGGRGDRLRRGRSGLAGRIVSGGSSSRSA